MNIYYVAINPDLTILIKLDWQFQIRGGIYRGINRYKPSCHKQVSDTQNVRDYHKHVINNKTVENCDTFLIRLKSFSLFMLMKMLKTIFFAFLFQSNILIAFS